MTFQVIGLAATSFWLHAAIQTIPGYEGSDLARLAPHLPTEGPALRFLRDALLTGVAEELVFRGLLFALLQRWQGTRLALLGSALLFGAAHEGPHYAAVAFALGLQLGLIRIAHGLSVAILAHVTNNALAQAVGAAAQASPGPLMQPPAQAAVLLLAVIVSALACAALRQEVCKRDAPTVDPGSGL